MRNRWCAGDELETIPSRNSGASFLSTGSASRRRVLAAGRERLALWGPDVQVGVPDDSSVTGWSARTLREVNPFYWGSRFTEDGAWPGPEVHFS